MKLLLTLTMLFASYANSAIIALEDNNTISIRGVVTSELMSAKTRELYAKSSKLPKNVPLYVVLYTPGGSIDAGNLFIEAAKGLNRKVHTITIFAASMGYHIAQSLDYRFIVGSGVLMSHRAAIGGLSGQIPGEANSRLEWLTGLTTLMDKAVAKRIGKSLADYQKSIVNELWLLSDAAVANGHSDAVVSINCGESLQATESQTVASMFGSFHVTFSKCPLITAPISATSSSGKKLTKAVESAIFDLFNPQKVLSKTNGNSIL